MIRRALVVSLLVGIATASAQQARAPQIESITQEQLRADLFFLASDSMQGRLTDTPTNMMAGEWVLSRFERLGLRPAGNVEFEHRYSLMTASLADGNAMQVGTLSTGGTRADLRLLEEFYPHRFSANATVEAPLTFV